MAYVFDTSSFIVIGHYYPDQFPKFWEKFNQAVEIGKIISVREVLRELDRNAAEDHLVEWIKLHKNIFASPDPAVTRFTNDILKHRCQIERGCETPLSRIRLLLPKQRL